jgi:hypothetical protein
VFGLSPVIWKLNVLPDTVTWLVHPSEQDDVVPQSNLRSVMLAPPSLVTAPHTVPDAWVKPVALRVSTVGVVTVGVGGGIV